MDVRLPDGTVIRGVPEGTTRQQLVDKLSANGYDTSGFGTSTAQQSANMQARGANMAAVRSMDNAQGEAAEIIAPEHLDNPLVAGVMGGVNALNRAAMGVKSLFTDLSPQELAIRRGLEEAQRQGGTAATVGDVATDIGMSLAPIGAVNKGVQAVRAAQHAPRLVKALAASRAAVPAADIAANAGYAAATAPEDRLQAGAVGGAGAAAGRVAARAIAGPANQTVSREAQTLLDRGVALTPGQVSGTRSAVGALEEGVASNPFFGMSVNPARRRGVEEANLALVQSVVDDVGGKVKRGVPLHQALDDGYEAVGEAYRKSLDGASFNNSGQLEYIVNGKRVTVPGETISSMSDGFAHKAIEGNHLLDATHARELGRYAQGIGQRLQAAEVSGETLKQIDSEIGYMARQLEKSPDPRDRVAASSWRTFQSEWRDLIAFSQKDADQRELLKKANQAYRELLALDKAKGQSEHIIPRRLVKTLGDRNITGRPVNEVAAAMEKTLPNAVPNSGTAERLIAAALPGALMGGGVGAQYLGDPLGLGTMALGAGAAMSRPGVRYMTGQLAPSVQAAALRAIPTASKVGRSIAAQQYRESEEERIRRVLAEAERMAEQYR